ncbi:MAG: HU family DNA-binding protein [Actinobacteria bacterium]|nr:HU family DNA-binding protein [Actinomycetota bacterium]
MVGKAQIVERVAAAGGTRAQAALAVDAVLDAVTAELVAGERVTLTGFGTFEPVARPARTVRNPRTGGVVEVAASVAARFRPGAGLRSALAGAGSPAATVTSVQAEPTAKPAAKPAANQAAKPAPEPAAPSTAKASKKSASKASAKPTAKASGKSDPKAKAASKGKKKKR